MSLSNMNKDVITRLMSMISSSDNDLNIVKYNHVAYAKLNMLATQMQMLREQAFHILTEAQMNERLQKAEMRTKQTPGTTYYLYTQNSKDVLSLVSPMEWDSYEEYHGAFLYDFDHTFRKV